MSKKKNTYSEFFIFLCWESWFFRSWKLVYSWQKCAVCLHMDGGREPIKTLKKQSKAKLQDQSGSGCKVLLEYIVNVIRVLIESLYKLISDKTNIRNRPIRGISYLKYCHWPSSSHHTQHGEASDNLTGLSAGKFQHV